MQEPRDEDLILYYYGEAKNAAEIRRRLEVSPAAAERYAELCSTLELVERQPVPEPFGDYGARVWRRLEPRLKERPSRRARGWLAGLFMPNRGARIALSRLAAGATVAALVAVAFLAGRNWPSPEGEVGGPFSAAGRERILLVSVGEHLERSEMLLIELANAPAGSVAGLSDELRRAEQLLPFNRLYRQAARRSGRAGIAEVLDELERLLLDVAHSHELSAAQIDELRERIEGDGILFRVQVVGSRVDAQNQRSILPAAAGEV